MRKIILLTGILLLTGIISASLQQANAADGKNEVPEAVKASFPNAQSITMQHRDLTPAQISSIEKGSSSKLADKDFHAYVAFGSQGGKRVQLGAATIVDVAGAGGPMQLLVVYTNDITIKKVSPIKGSGDVASPAFLDQFAGKDHDQPFHLGKDVKYAGKNSAAAEAVAHALKRDILAMQTLYGKAHTH